MSSELGGPRARRPGTEAGDATRVNTQDHGRKNQPVTEGEGHSSSSGCREGTGMGIETPGFRGFEQGQIRCGQKLRGRGQNKARERSICQAQVLHVCSLTTSFGQLSTPCYFSIFYAGLDYSISLLLSITAAKY